MDAVLRQALGMEGQGGVEENTVSFEVYPASLSKRVRPGNGRVFENGMLCPQNVLSARPGAARRVLHVVCVEIRPAS